MEIFLRKRPASAAQDASAVGTREPGLVPGLVPAPPTLRSPQVCVTMPAHCRSITSPTPSQEDLSGVCSGLHRHPYRPRSVPARTREAFCRLCRFCRCRTSEAFFRGSVRPFPDTIPGFPVEAILRKKSGVRFGVRCVPKMRVNEGNKKTVNYLRISMILIGKHGLSCVVNIPRERAHNPKVRGSNPLPATICIPLFPKLSL